MNKNAILSLAITVALTSTTACARNTFDWSLLQGKWAESSENKFACRPDNLHQQFEVSADRKTLVFKNDRKWRMGKGPEIEKYSAAIVSHAPNVLVIKYGSDLKDIPEKYREWEIRFIGPGTYRWRATSWPVDRYNDVIGVKCEAK